MPTKPTNPYLLGATAFISCRRDPRFSYCLYVPRSLNWSAAQRAPLLVVIHGSRRMAQQECSAFADFAEEHGVVVLAPLFPMWSATPTETEGYKLMRAYGVEYDQVVLAMIDEVANRYPIATERFLLHGFSGGGQFANRFYFYHPERLWAVSIGAPGSVTLLDGEQKWPVGTGGIGTDGRGPDLAAMRRVPVHLLVGSLDTDTHEVTIRPTSEHWHEGINDCGGDRIEKLTSLSASFRSHGIDVTTSIVEGVSHEGFRIVPAAVEYFTRVLNTSARCATEYLR